MLTSAYKYLAIGGVALALIVGAFLYGMHTGKTAGIAVLNETVAKLNQQASDTLQAALAKQATQDALRLKEAQDAVTQAQAAKQTAQATLSDLSAKLKAISHEQAVSTWNNVCIPAAIRSSVQFSSSCPGDQGSNGHPNPIHPGPGWFAAAVPSWSGLGHPDQC